jgi:hypothetical protein
MKNTGYTIKIADAGYMVEYFSMNSQTFDVQIIETRGPFEDRKAAEQAETEMRREREDD